MTAPLTQDQIATVKATAPVLKEHGTTITSLFYKNMLAAHPELHNVFNMANQASGVQPRALANAVFAYATYVDDLAQLRAVVERIAHKHASLSIQPDHYPIVGKYLLEAVATVLGDACTPQIAEAWTAAYACLADVFISREQQIYAAFENWKGWRRFRIQKKVPESSEITSFFLAPEDGRPLPSFLPGQYVSIQLSIPQLGYMQPRQYSLSESPRSDYYRISVKKEKGKDIDIAGLVSNLLHENYKEGDIVELTHPTGEFFAQPDEDGPIVLISAGVGITPMISILNTMVENKSSRPVLLVHGAHSTEVRAFKEHLTRACEKPNVNATAFLSAPQSHEVKGVDYDFEGRMSLAKLDMKTLHIEDPNTNYYICGPTGFMKDTQATLVEQGVSETRVHLELFGVGGD
ncbi:globin-like protein [Xylariaceae sp. FL0016]|nr:globin-like protein [Xylariaceae sp. FL0016]